MSKTCPVCEKGHLSLTEYARDIKYGDHVYQVKGFQKLICDHCGSSIAEAEQMRHNKRLVIRFRKDRDGLLSGDEIAVIRRRYSLTQKQASLLFGGGPTAFSKYENDEVAQSDAMDRLLRMASKYQHVVEDLALKAGVVLKLRVSYTAVSRRRKTDLELPAGCMPLEGVARFVRFEHHEVALTNDDSASDASKSAAA